MTLCHRICASPSFHMVGVRFGNRRNGLTSERRGNRRAA